MFASGTPEHMIWKTQLTVAPAALVGDWYPEPGRWRWEGTARAREPLVGVIFCDDQSGSIRWARSDHRASDAGLPVVLHLSRIGTQLWLYAGVGRPAGRGFVQARTTVQEFAPPTVTSAVRSGELLRLATTPGEPSIGISILLLSRKDVRSRRLGLWGVKPVLLGALQDPWRTVLQYGRSGVLRCELPAFSAGSK